MEPTNTGSFAAAIGGSQALNEAAKRRGIDLSAIQQTSPASAGGAPPVPPPISDVSTAQSAVGQEVPAQPVQPEAPQSTDPELASAIEALGSFVKSGGKTRNELAKGRLQGLI